MGAISTVDVQTRLDIYELLSRYCHFVDQGMADAWAGLFTQDGVFEIESAMRLEGREQLKAMPGIVIEQGKGLWRHQITNIMVDRVSNPRELMVSAYGLVTDWGNGGALFAFSDYRIALRNSGCWHIGHLYAKTVTAGQQPV